MVPPMAISQHAARRGDSGGPDQADPGPAAAGQSPAGPAAPGPAPGGGGAPPGTAPAAPAAAARAARLDTRARAGSRSAVQTTYPNRASARTSASVGKRAPPPMPPRPASDAARTVVVTAANMYTIA